MNTLNRKLLRELSGHWGMLAAVAGIIAVGVTCLVTLVSCYLNLSDATRLYYAQCRMADFSMELKKAPLTELVQLEAFPEVAEIRPRIQQLVTVDLPGVTKPLSGLVLSLPDRRRSIINDIVIKEGGYFSERRDNEVIVNEWFARHYRLRPGQYIRLLLNNRQQELLIVGTAVSSEFVYLLAPGSLVPDPQHFGVFYLKQSYTEEVFDFQGSANQVLGRLNAAAGGNVHEVLRRAENLLTDYGVFSTTPLGEQLSNKFLMQELQGLRSFAVITPAMFLAAAALVLSVLLSRLAQQQRTVVGTLKALGYSDLEIFWHFLKFGLTVGLLGGAVGCVCGSWLARGVTAIYRTFYQFPELPYRARWAVFAIGMAISLGCAALGSLRGSRVVLRLRAAEAMRPAPPRRGGPVFLERWPAFWLSLGTAWRMVLRNVLRNRLRTAACVFAAAMGACVLVNGFMMHLAMDFLIDFQFEKVTRNDVELSLKDERDMAALSEARGLPGVDYAEPVFNLACTFINGPYRKKGSITGLVSEASLTLPRDTDARRLKAPKHGLLMSRRLAETLHLRRGGLVGVEPVKGERRLQFVPVAQIADGYLGTAVYADFHCLNRLIGEEATLNSVQLNLDRTPENYAAFYYSLKQLPGIQAVNMRADMAKSLRDTVLQNQGLVITFFIGFAGILFFGSILNTALVSLAERQGEIATLRALGYGPWQVGSLLLRESMIAAMLGALWGLPLGYLLTIITAEMYASDLFRLPIITTPGLWILTLALAVAFGLLTHLCVQRSIHKTAWLDALKTQE